MKTPYARTLALNLERNLLLAALPLLEAGRVDAIEWSFDALDGVPELPDWFADLLSTYSQAGRLIGHGIFYGVCSANWTEEQDRWLAKLRAWQQRFPLDHVTEHFGFMTGKDFHRGAPISPPLSNATLAVGQDRLLRLSAACGRPLGLENLALAYHADDVRRQGEFIARLLEPVNGFILLDAHNLYCQAHNFGIDPLELCRAYPLDLVREIHISGGSWETHPSAPEGRVRRDTHDDRVPEDVFSILEFLLTSCPNLTYVTLEQLGPALETPAQREGLIIDFDRMCDHLRSAPPGVAVKSRSFEPPRFQPKVIPHSDPKLAGEQTLLAHLLETSSTVAELKNALSDSALASSSWQTEQWDEHMLETVWGIARKWR